MIHSYLLEGGERRTRFERESLECMLYLLYLVVARIQLICANKYNCINEYNCIIYISTIVLLVSTKYIKMENEREGTEKGRK